jgi:MFS family permease
MARAHEQTPAVGRPAGRQLPRGLSSFGHRNFRLFWFGQLISLAGTWMQSVAQAWLVLQLTSDPLALGIVAAAQFTPVLVLGLFAGVYADSVNKRTALIWTQVSAAVLALVLGLLVFGNVVQVWQVFVLALLLGVVNAFDMPIRQAFVVEMVGRDDVANAVALNSAVFNGTRIVGPAIAGIFIATIGIAPLFFFNAVSYLAVVAGLLMMRTGELHRPRERLAVGRNPRSVVDHLVEGLRYVGATKLILVPIVVLGVVSTFTLNFQVLIPVFARDVLHGEADTYGFLMAASGAGSLASALAIAFFMRPTMRLLLAGTAVIGAGFLGLSLIASLPLDMVLMFVVGFGVIAMAATTNTTIQLSTPDALRGRVMSVYTTVFAGSVPFGGLFSGVLAAAAGVQVALAVGGVIALLAAIGAAAWLRRPAPAASAAA